LPWQQHARREGLQAANRLRDLLHQLWIVFLLLLVGLQTLNH